MLSDLMRHVLYESQKDFIPVHKELEFAKNFIELQKLRHGRQVEISAHISDNIPDGFILPLIFEPFIDNAFKHGLRSPAEKPFIHIHITHQNGRILFSLCNNYLPGVQPKKSETSGVGLANVRRRLQMLYNENDFQLEMTSSGNQFTVKLSVKLLN